MTAAPIDCVSISDGDSDAELVMDADHTGIAVEALDELGEPDDCMEFFSMPRVCPRVTLMGGRASTSLDIRNGYDLRSCDGLAAAMGKLRHRRPNVLMCPPRNLWKAQTFMEGCARTRLRFEICWQNYDFARLMSHLGISFSGHGHDHFRMQQGRLPVHDFRFVSCC